MDDYPGKPGPKPTAPLDPRPLDAVLRADFARWQDHAPLPPAVVNGILRLQDQGWTPAQIARELNRWDKPSLSRRHPEWSAIEVRLVIVVVQDSALLDLLSPV